ncbi:hypothetical protein Q5P01_007116 [Channa striata]|uniref:Immunoglobulin subtype domain-containing protein n=1 Tax=Channa striata TaxID=64152 RepID=A0AA88SUK4_CHASR|nr:hypothetical protein Q5P01_007116 [Channa striata]
MKIHHVLLFCFLSAAFCGGNTGTVSGQLSTYTGAAGGNGTMKCYLPVSGNTKFFCKEECQNVVTVTDGVTAKSGRYSITYRNVSLKTVILSVNFINLTQTDSGRYRCGLGKTFVAPDSYWNFEIRVSDAPLGITSDFVRTNTEGENATYECITAVGEGAFFFCKNQCRKQEDVLMNTTSLKAQSGRYAIEFIRGSIFGLYVTITKVNKSDTRWYRCGYGDPWSPNSNFSFPVLVNGECVVRLMKMLLHNLCSVQNI